ncbi:MAG: toll/interleukin-1 receptor domain-containing protein [Lachnospiraceae bacterium]|nr:toll/interleukin-1 receptor domain-containing protein [Lachnospiraceae bacterium]
MGLSGDEKREREEALRNLITTNYTDSSRYIFVSYVSNNWKRVFQEIVIPLQQKYGLRVYADKELNNRNENWITQVLDNIKDAAGIMLFVSEDYIASYAACIELLEGIKEGKDIIPVYLSEKKNLEKPTGDLASSKVKMTTTEKECLSLIGKTIDREADGSGAAMKSAAHSYNDIAISLKDNAITRQQLYKAFMKILNEAGFQDNYLTGPRSLDSLYETIKSVSKDVFDPNLKESSKGEHATPSFGKVSAAQVSSKPETKADAQQSPFEAAQTVEKEVAASVPPEKALLTTSVNQPESVRESGDNSITYFPDGKTYQRSGRNAKYDALYRIENDIYTVLRGSRLQRDNQWVSQRYREYLDKISADGILMEDVAFDTMSAAAKFIEAVSTNGSELLSEKNLLRVSVTRILANPESETDAVQPKSDDLLIPSGQESAAGKIPANPYSEDMSGDKDGSENASKGIWRYQVKNGDAHIQWDGEGRECVVLAGSRTAKESDKFRNVQGYGLKKELERQGVIVDDVFTQDFQYNGIATIINVIAGGSQSRRREMGSGNLYLETSGSETPNTSVENAGNTSADGGFSAGDDTDVEGSGDIIRPRSLF